MIGDDDAEMDTESEETETKQSEPVQSLDSFLRDMHETSTKVTSASGIPNLTWLKENFKSKSGIIRYLKQLGMSPKDASEHTGFAYQHVYNVMHQELKRGPNEVYTPVKTWQCDHIHAPIIVDVIIRKGDRDPDGTRILYRVCSDCARDLIPGVTEDSIKVALPGVKDAST